MTQFILGGAQLGSNYGVFSRHLDRGSRRQESAKILRVAEDLGITAVDTARSYPSSEELLGEFHWSGEIHTKLKEGQPPLESLERSLTALRRDAVGLLYLFHQLSSWHVSTLEQTTEHIERLRGCASRIGVSVYSVEEAESFSAFDEIDVVQVPYNIASSIDTSDLRRWKNSGKQVVARSVFLQGVLVETSSLPSSPGLKAFIDAFHALCQAFGRNPKEVALGWIRHADVFDGVIVGAESPQQLEETYSAFVSARLSDEEYEALRSIPRPDPGLIDPRKWKDGGPR